MNMSMNREDKAAWKLIAIIFIIVFIIIAYLISKANANVSYSTHTATAAEKTFIQIENYKSYSVSCYISSTGQFDSFWIPARKKSRYYRVIGEYKWNCK